MAEENLEVVRGAWDAWLRGDIDDVLAHYDPQVMWDLTHFRDWPESTYHGPAGVERFYAEWLELWDGYEVGVEEIVSAPDGRVVCVAWQRGVGRRSGLTMEMKWAQIVTVRNGMITRIDNYDDLGEALTAAGVHT